MEAAECICQAQEGPILPEPTAQNSADHRSILAQMYSKAMTKPLTQSDISLHLDCDKLLVASRVPTQDTTRVLVEARQVHLKNPKPTKIVLDLSPSFIQDLIDAYTSTGGTALLRGHATCGSGMVIRPTILRDDL